MVPPCLSEGSIVSTVFKKDSFITLYNSIPVLLYPFTNIASDLRCAICVALEGKLESLVTFWGICCSSWVHMNAGTSQRDALTPMGCAAFDSVNMANLLTSRFGCQIMVENPIVFLGLPSSSSIPEVNSPHPPMHMHGRGPSDREPWHISDLDA